MLVQARKGSADCCDEPGLGLGDKGGVGPPWTVRRYSALTVPVGNLVLGTYGE